MSSASIDEVDFEYRKIEDLPRYWQMKIWGWQRRGSRCPYDGGALTRREKPIDHFNCPKCGRNYA